MSARRKTPRDGSPWGRAAALLDGAREMAVALQAELVRRNAVGPSSGGPGESEKADFVAAWMEANGFPPVARYTADDGGVPRPNLCCILPGRDRTRRLWFLSHLDVVPPGDASLWKGDAFVLRVEGDKLVGRGVEDNHQGIVSSLLAARALLALQEPPECDVGLLFVADEETGSRFGIRWLLDHHRDLFGSRDAFVVPDAGNEDGTLVEVAEKAIAWLRIRTVGKQVHASTPHQGRNAMVAASHLIMRMADLHARYDERNPLFDPPVSTFEPTKREANVPNVNTIPGEDVFWMDCRILPGLPVDQVVASVREIADEVSRNHRVVMKVEVAQREDAAPPTPPDAPLVLQVLKSIRKVYNVEPRPRGIGGGTVAAYLRREGWPVVVWARQDETAHQPNEYAWLPNLLGDAKVFADLMLGESPQVPLPEPPPPAPEAGGA